MPRNVALAEFLRARRELVRPEDVGLSANGRRRVAGLRREEVAALAGISPDYYLRLEQGRDHEPSVQVVEALARALQLNEVAAEPLRGLARPSVRRPRRAPNGEVKALAAVERLIQSWLRTPAWVCNPYLDVLASNAVACALSPIFAPGGNLVHAVFLDARTRDLIVDWEAAAHLSAGRLRALAGADPDDGRLGEMVVALSARSSEFRQLWSRHDVELAPSVSRSYRHPVVGRLDLLSQTLAVNGTDGLVLTFYYAEPSSPAEAALEELARIAGSGA